MAQERVRYPRSIGAGRTDLDAARPHAIYRERGMDVWTLNYTLHGRGRISRGREGFASRVGDLLLWPPDVRHDYGHDEATGQWTHLWICFFPRQHWQAWLDWPVGPGGVRQLHLADRSLRRRVVARFRDVIRHVHGPQRRHEEFGMNGLEEILLWADSVNPRSEQAVLDSRVQTVLGLLCDRFDEPLTLGELAAACSLSASRLSHLFREQVGCAPMQYLEHLRIARAQESLIATGKPVSEIAFDVGYEDPLYFSRVFRRQVGVSPRAYRRAPPRVGRR